MIKTHINESKILNAKGQKIIAAVFLVTGHLPEIDPMRQKLRGLAIALSDNNYDDRYTLCTTIGALLESAVLARLIQEHNARIIQSELKYYADPQYQEDTAIAALFPAPVIDKGHFLNKRTDIAPMSFITKPAPSDNPERVEKNTVFSRDNKSKRQETILSYINNRKSANVKDISLLFPDVSEKTIQRELGALVVSGKITKRGNKRWSIYLAL